MLELREIQAWYGAAQALHGVSLRVEPGELVVLQGLNGAGKSTLLQSIMGLVPRVRGELRFQGVDLAPLTPFARARLGLGYVPEDRRLFAALSVRDNLRIALPGGVHDRSATVRAREERVLALFPALARMLDRPAARMSGGEQQMLSLARTLMTGPSLLLLDEPCEGIAPVLVAAIRDALLALSAEGAALLVAEQNRILAERAHRVITLAAQRPCLAL